MTNTTYTTSHVERTKRTARLEAALDKACDNLHRFQTAHPGKDLDVHVFVVEAVIDKILARHPETLGDIQIWAKAMRNRYDCDCDAEVFDLLQVLQELPERLWDEPIVRQVERHQ